MILKKNNSKIFPQKFWGGKQTVVQYCTSNIWEVILRCCAAWSELDVLLLTHTGQEDNTPIQATWSVNTVRRLTVHGCNKPQRQHLQRRAGSCVSEMISPDRAGGKKKMQHRGHDRIKKTSKEIRYCIWWNHNLQQQWQGRTALSNVRSAN